MGGDGGRDRKGFASLGKKVQIQVIQAAHYFPRSRVCGVYELLERACLPHVVVWDIEEDACRAIQPVEIRLGYVIGPGRQGGIHALQAVEDCVGEMYEEGLILLESQVGSMG